MDDEEVTPDGADYQLQATLTISGSRYLSDIEDDITSALAGLTTVTVVVSSVMLTDAP